MWNHCHAIYSWRWDSEGVVCFHQWSLTRALPQAKYMVRRVSWWICTALAKACWSRPLLWPDVWLPSALKSQKCSGIRFTKKDVQKARGVDSSHMTWTWVRLQTQQNQENCNATWIWTPMTLNFTRTKMCTMRLFLRAVNKQKTEFLIQEIVCRS